MNSTARPGRARYIGIGLAAAGSVIVLLLVAAQVVLPGIASSRLTHSLEKHGTGVQVSISAFPAVELLFHHADTVVVHIATLHTSQGHAGHLIQQLREAGSLDATVNRFDDDGLYLRNLRVTLRGKTLSASAIITQQAINQKLAQLPFSLRLTPSRQGIVLTEDEHVLGHHQLSERLTVVAGAIVIEPDLSGLASLANHLVHFTVFSNPALLVNRVTASAVNGGYRVSATGTYR